MRGEFTAKKIGETLENKSKRKEKRGRVKGGELHRGESFAANGSGKKKREKTGQRGERGES